MGRDVPFNPEAICDGCGHKGAFDFMGDFYCEECCSVDIPSDVDDELKS